jgi:hypothetical protein
LDLVCSGLTDWTLNIWLLWTKKASNWIGFLLTRGAGAGGGAIRPNFIGIEPPLIKLQRKACYTVHCGLLVGKKSGNWLVYLEWLVNPSCQAMSPRPRLHHKPREVVPDSVHILLDGWWIYYHTDGCKLAKGRSSAMWKCCTQVHPKLSNILRVSFGKHREAKP